MKEGVYAESVEGLEEFALRYQRFAEEVARILQEVEHEFRRRWEDLMHRYRVQQARVARLQRQVEEADEEEAAYSRRRLEEAEERLRRMRMILSRLEGQYQEYRRQTLLLQKLVEERTPKAVAFLRNRAAELRAYIGVSLSESPGAGGASSAPALSGESKSITPAEESGPATPPESAPNFTRYALPHGFQWVPLDAIDCEDLPPDAFSKVPVKAIRQGMARLPEVLALLQDRLHLPSIDNSMYFLRLDRRAGRTYEEGLQRVYDAFFGSEPICLERQSGTSRWRVLNGRHRIQIARELGWTAVPALVGSSEGEETG